MFFYLFKFFKQHFYWVDTHQNKNEWQELNSKLEEFASSTDNLEEIFENREQIEISKFYERLPKPVSIAIQEYLEDKIYFRNPSKEEGQDA